jgi:cytochrome P450
MGMFIAAIDNTGVIMGMILYCLARYPAEGKLVREEVERVCGTRDITAALKHEDLSRLDYTLAFIKEVFRHYSSSTGIFIRCAQ